MLGNAGAAGVHLGDKRGSNQMIDFPRLNAAMARQAVVGRLGCLGCSR